MPGTSTAITTFLRLRPSKQGDGFFVADSPKHVEVHVPAETAAGMINHKRTDWRFAFDGILPTDAKQEEVFERVAEPVVESVLSGFNGTVFAYGQTGSGKTYTLTGGVTAYAERGVIPRTLSAVFARIGADTEAEYTVRISYLEIYNEVGFDLLDARQSAAAGSKHGDMTATPAGLAQLARVQGCVEEEDGSVRVQGLSSHVVASEEAAINLLFVGDTNRAVSETSMNALSSRSHCVFTITVEARPVGEATVRRSKLHLVDLAGSERIGKSGASGSTLNEAIHINSSLFQLQLVIMALHEKQSRVRVRTSARPHDLELPRPAST
jgi:kinesin family protein 6/9